MRFQVESSFGLIGGKEKLWNINYKIKISCLEAKGLAFCSPSQPIIDCGCCPWWRDKGGYNLLSLVPPNGGEQCSEKVAAHSYMSTH